MILQDVLTKTIQFFKERKIETARLDAEILISKALGLKRIDLYLKFDQPLKDHEIEKCRDMVRRRSKGESVAYILNEKDFFRHTFFVDSRVLVPRPETELLVEKVLERTQDQTGVRILDLGSGSGCLGLSILKDKGADSQAWFVDISQAALDVTQMNAERLEVLPRAHFLCGDAAKVSFEPEFFDIIVMNPPYIDPSDSGVQASVREFEPNLALFASDEGFEFIEKWTTKHRGELKVNGWMGSELGSGHRDRALELYGRLGLKDVQIIQDLAGHDRHVIGRG
jgi:release factor glutamine methyltransferase